MKKKACIVRPHNAGLFSQINKVMLCASMYEHVHVDWTGNTTYGDPKDNLWNHLFEPTENRGGDVIVDYPDQSITGSQAGHLYGTTGWREKYSVIWKRFTVLPKLEKIAMRMVETWNEPAIGCIVRFHGHSREQLSDQSQRLEDYISKIRTGPRPRHHAPVYLMCGDNETLAFFQRKFGDRLCWWADTFRTPTRDENQMDARKQTILDAQMVLVEALAMSHCRTLIHPTSNIATWCLYANPKMESVYLR